MISTATELARLGGRDVLGGVGVGDLDRQPGPLEAAVADQRAGVGERRVDLVGPRLLGQALDPQHDLHLDRRRALELLVDVPPPVRRLAPARPVERHVGHDPWRLALAGQPVARLPRDVAEQDVDLEVLLERLALQERCLSTHHAAR